MNNTFQHFNNDFDSKYCSPVMNWHNDIPFLESETEQLIPWETEFINGNHNLFNYDTPILINPVTYHKIDCSWQKCPNKREKKYCGSKPKKGKVCGGALVSQACSHMENDTMVGICSNHYKKLCKKNGWNYQLSQCANIQCDLLNLGALRFSITNDNLTALIGFPVGYGHYVKPKKISKIKNNKNRKNN